MIQQAANAQGTASALPQLQSSMADTSSSKSKKRPYCWRCKCSGHSVDGCKANLDCIVCNKKNSHISAKCPILKMPKPNATFFGFDRNDMGFLRMPECDFKLEKPDPEPTALIKVTGGKLPAEVIQTELARITRADWKWEALPHGDDSFLVAFPSDDELQRMIDIEFRLKNHGVTLIISEWQATGDIVPSYQLDEVWVHITGVPHAWRHYLSFWALGTVIGATLDVDMLTYRKKGVIRFRVGMLNRNLLPFSTDLVFGVEGYVVTFAVEENNFEHAIPPPDDTDHMDQDDPKSGGDDFMEDNKDQTTKKQKNTGGMGGSTSAPVTIKTSSMHHLIVVTHFGNKRSAPLAKILLDSDAPIPKIVVTPPRMGKSATKNSNGGHGLESEGDLSACADTVSDLGLAHVSEGIQVSTSPSGKDMSSRKQNQGMIFDTKRRDSTGEDEARETVKVKGAPTTASWGMGGSALATSTLNSGAASYMSSPSDKDTVLKAMRRAAARKLGWA